MTPAMRMRNGSEPRQLHALRRGLAGRQLVAGLWRGLLPRTKAAAHRAVGQEPTLLPPSLLVRGNAHLNARHAVLKAHPMHRKRAVSAVLMRHGTWQTCRQV